MALLDPLDRKLFQRAFDAACSAVKADELDSDEKLEAALRCELLSIAVLNGMSDPAAVGLAMSRDREGSYPDWQPRRLGVAVSSNWRRRNTDSTNRSCQYEPLGYKATNTRRSRSYIHSSRATIHRLRRLRSDSGSDCGHG